MSNNWVSDAEKFLYSSLTCRSKQFDIIAIIKKLEKRISPDSEISATCWSIWFNGKLASKEIVCESNLCIIAFLIKRLGSVCCSKGVGGVRSSLH